MLIAFGRTTDQVGCTCMMLVKDNASTIRAALDSAISSGCFREILVLIDVRSIDGTGRIVFDYSKAYPGLVRIIPYKWSEPPDFAAARNHVLRLVRTRYAFWVDGDEEIIDPAGLRGFLQGARGESFWMFVTSPLAGGGTFDMYQPRLVPVVAGVGFECPVFERIDWSLDRAGVPAVKTARTVIYHSGYIHRPTLDAKNARNRSILRHALPRYGGGIAQRRHMQKQYRALRGR